MAHRPIPLNMKLFRLDGTPVSVADIFKDQVKLLMVYKKACETSLFTIELLKDYFRRFPESRDFILFISQDSLADSQQFVQQFGIPFETFVDHPDYQLSRAMDFQAVPAFFLLNASGRILKSSEGFFRDEFVSILEQAAKMNNFSPAKIFENPDEIPIMKPG